VCLYTADYRKTELNWTSAGNCPEYGSWAMPSVAVRVSMVSRTSKSGIGSVFTIVIMAFGKKRGMWGSGCCKWLGLVALGLGQLLVASAVVLRWFAAICRYSDRASTFKQISRRSAMLGYSLQTLLKG